MPRSPITMLIAVQATVAVTALIALTLYPPLSGKFLLVPIFDRDVSRVANVALAGQARLLGSGPFPGSLVVVGDRASITRQIKSLNIIVLAAPRAGCGNADAPA